jgi:hypothetical protein
MVGIEATRELGDSSKKPTKTLADFLNLLDALGGAVAADAPLIKYRRKDFSAALEGGFVDLDSSGEGRYALTALGRKALGQRWPSVIAGALRSVCSPVSLVARRQN